MEKKFILNLLSRNLLQITLLKSSLRLPRLPKSELSPAEKDTQRKKLNNFLIKCTDMNRAIVPEDDPETIYLFRKKFRHLQKLDIGSATCFRNVL
jgi:hypothetical protein